MTWRVGFSRQRNIHLPVQQGDTCKTLRSCRRETLIRFFLFFCFLLVPLPSSPQTAGVWQERRDAFVPGEERASG